MATLITDPIDLLLGSDGDLDVGTDLTFSSGLAAVAQGITIRLAKQRGEWFANRDEGVPWLPNDVVAESAAILGQKFNEAKVRAAVRDAILAAPGVLGIASLVVSFDRATRTVAVTWSARTIFGDTDPDTLEI